MSGSRVRWAEAASKGTASPPSKQKASSPAAHHGGRWEEKLAGAVNTNSRGLAGKLSASEDNWSRAGRKLGLIHTCLRHSSLLCLGQGIGQRPEYITRYTGGPEARCRDAERV